MVNLNVISYVNGFSYSIERPQQPCWGVMMNTLLMKGFASGQNFPAKSLSPITHGLGFSVE